MAVSQSLAVTQTSQNVGSNSSQVRIRWTSTQTGESYNGYTKTAYYYVSVNGGSETRYSVSYTLPKGSTKVLADKTITVNHKADGTGSVRVRTWMDTGISAGEIEKSDSLTLTRIPRATTPTLSATSVNMGSTVTISMPRASSNFTHNLSYRFEGGSSTSIASGLGTSYTWTVPNKASSIPNGVAGEFAIKCDTYSGSTLIGSKTVYLTGRVPSATVPVVGAVTVVEAATGLPSGLSTYVQNKSKLRISITAAGVGGSSLDTFQAVVDGVTFTAYTFDDLRSKVLARTLTRSGEQIVKARVRDTRERWSAWVSTTITVAAYSAPKITALSASRVNTSNQPDEDGTRLNVEYAYSVSSLGGTNTASMTVKWRLFGQTTWSNAIVTSTALSADSGKVVTSPAFSVDSSYELLMEVTDFFGAKTSATTVLRTGAVILDLLADGTGIGIGKVAEGPGIDFGWDIVRQLVAPGSLSGRYRTHDGILFQWGSVTITPSAANTPTTVIVTFPEPYTLAPVVVATPITGVPQTLSVGVQRALDLVGDTKIATAITLTRGNLTGTSINWLAIGKG